MDAKGIEKIEDKIENVEHVTDIISYNSMVGAEVPTEIIPSKYRSYFENQESGCTMFMIFFDDTTSSDGTMAAIQELRNIADGQCFISGMSAVVTDTKNITQQETIAYVVIACSPYKYCTGTVYGFFPCTGILYVKYRYGDCLQLRL